VAALPPQGAPWRRSERCPDPAVRVLDKRFEKYYLYHARVERLAEGCGWSEGPVWFGDGRYLLWSDIPNSRIMKWEESTGAVSVFRSPSGYANGNTRDRQGRLVTCEHAEAQLVQIRLACGSTFASKRTASANGSGLTRPRRLIVFRVAYTVARPMVGNCPRTAA